MSLNLDLWPEELVVIKKDDTSSVFQFRSVSAEEIEVSYNGPLTLTDFSGRRVSGKFSVRSGDFLDFEHCGEVGCIDLYSRGHRVRARFDADRSFIIIRK